MVGLEWVGVVGLEWVGVVGLECYPCCRLQPATRIPLQTNHTESPTHIERRTINLGSMCFGISFWLCWSGSRVAG